MQCGYFELILNTFIRKKSLKKYFEVKNNRKIWILSPYNETKKDPILLVVSIEM